ncbi:MAG: hypothetical protein KIT18_12180 [Burkholderiales bacterium]|nr:hypothetical protein [Burkholderiales bacterium]
MSPCTPRSEPDYSQHPDYAIAALLLMLARFPLTECHTIADSIAAHLQFVAGDARFPDVIRHAAAQSSSEWKAMIAMRTEIERQHGLLN